MLKVPFVKFYVNSDVKNAINKVLESGRYVLGDENRSFEREFASYIGVKYGVATSSGTASLFLILKALGIGVGDEVIVPAFTFIASFSPVIMVGAKPVFVDVDYDTMTINPNLIERSISPKTKAIIVVHLFGHPADMDPIMEIAEKYGLIVIEDCAEAHGSKYKGRKVGSIGDVSFFSFYPTKNLTVFGEGGMILTNDYDLAEKIRLLRHHGEIEKEKYVMLGYNFRLSEIHAAIGRVELKRLDKYIERRRKLAKIYSNELREYVEVPIERDWAYHSYSVYTIKVNDRRRLVKYFEEHGVGYGIYYRRPANKYGILPPSIRQLNYNVAEQLSQKCISLPLSQNHSEEDILHVIDCIKKALGTQ